MNRYYKLFLHFIGILSFKRKPQEIEHSNKIFFSFLFLITLISYMNISILGINIPNIKIFMFFSILINNFSFLMILYIFLYKNNIQNRFIQTSCNLLGIEIINCLFFLFFVFINNHIYNEYIPFLLSLSIAIWFFFIRINIIRHSFNHGILFSLILLIMFFFISFIISMSVTFFISLLYNII